MDRALHLEEVRAGTVPEPSLPWPYRFFGSRLIGATPEELPRGVEWILSWAMAEARRTVAAGRAGPDLELVVGLQLAYGALKAEAAAVRVEPDQIGPRAGPVIAATRRLRHRQRAAVLLRYGLGLAEPETARIIGVRPSQISGILAAAAARIARIAARPVDVPRALRRSGRDPSRARIENQSGPEATVQRLPRPVVRQLVAPAPADAWTPPPEARSPVEVLIAPRTVQEREPAAVAAMPPSQAARTGGRWSLLGRIAAALSVGALFAWAVWPAYG